MYIAFIGATSGALNFRRREFGLICKLFPYLTGFWKRGIRPKTGKDSQNDGGENYRVLPFTTPALTMPRRLRCFTICYESRRVCNRGSPWSGRSPKQPAGSSHPSCSPGSG
jgi:hypothetical protein